MRVERQRTPEPFLGGFRMAEAALDHATMEELRRVPRSEPQRPLRVGQRLCAAAVTRQSPGEDIVAVDRRTIGASGAGKQQRLRELDRMIDVEQRRFQIRLDAVGAEQAPDCADQRVLPSRRSVVPGQPIEVTEGRDELRQRDPVHGAMLHGDRSPNVTKSRFDLSKAVDMSFVDYAMSVLGPYEPVANPRRPN